MPPGVPRPAIPLFPRRLADWHKVIERAKKGDGDAWRVAHKGDPRITPSASDHRLRRSGKKGPTFASNSGAALRLAARRIEPP